MSEKEGLGGIWRDIAIPLSIFSNKRTILESLIIYLKDYWNLNYHQVSGIIRRDERNVRRTYIKGKLEESTRKLGYEVPVPVGIFSTKLSALEAIVKYLHEESKLKFSEIGKILNRDIRTIWTVYQRAKKKNVK